MELHRIIDEIHIQYPFMGSRRVRTELARRGHNVNRKRVIRLMRDMSIGAIYPKPKTTLTNKAHKVYPYLLRNVEVTYPNQAWAIDVSYIQMAKGFLYLVAIIDGYLTLWIRAFVSKLLRKHLSAMGRQISSTQIKEFTQKLTAHGVRISMDRKGRWVDNVFIERLWRNLKFT